MAENQPTLFDVETWKPVVGYEGSYEVSDQGQVRSLNRIDARGNRRRGRMVAPRRTGLGYLQVGLYLGGKRKHLLIHRLVLEAFVGPCHEGMEACHGGSDRADNRLFNLRWDTRSGNVLDEVRMGTHNNARKTHCPNGHPLSGPNLVPSEAKKGSRTCLSCARARNRVRWYPDLKSSFKPISDSYYESIMASSNLPRPA